MTSAFDDDGPSMDLGHGVTAQFTSWGEHDMAGLMESHPRPDNGERCYGGLLFDLPDVREAFPGRPLWTVESLDPLTISPSVLCTICGHHGFIRGGRWEP